MPLFYKHWSFGKRFALHETSYRAGPHGPGLRDRHQLEPVHLLHHGGELGDDADAGDRPCGFRAQSLLQEQLPVPGMDGRGRDPGLSRIREGLHHALRGALRPCGRGAGARCGACADGHGVHRYPRKKRPTCARRSGASEERHRHQEQTYQRPVADGADQGPRPSRQLERGAPPGPARTAAGEHPLFPREVGAAPAALAARDPAHRAPDRAVLLSAAPDQGDERGLRHLLPLPHHDPAARPGADQRRRIPRIPAIAHQRVTASRNSTIRITAASILMHSASA